MLTKKGEIGDDADVNRSTYYAHFTDPYDQLKKLESDIAVKKAYEYIYASTGSFGMIYYWIMDNENTTLLLFHHGTNRGSNAVNQ